MTVVECGHRQGGAPERPFDSWSTSIGPRAEAAPEQQGTDLAGCSQTWGPVAGRGHGRRDAPGDAAGGSGPRWAQCPRV
ncbi:hypothetical protein QJS66_20795 [Kocuria rhizophila]|nr:hypothetical protein QJS66_20795 [Kocuria rhizophila]